MDQEKSIRSSDESDSFPDHLFAESQVKVGEWLSSTSPKEQTSADVANNSDFFDDQDDDDYIRDDLEQFEELAKFDKRESTGQDSADMPVENSEVIHEVTATESRYSEKTSMRDDGDAEDYMYAGSDGSDEYCIPLLDDDKNLVQDDQIDENASSASSDKRSDGSSDDDVDMYDSYLTNSQDLDDHMHSTQGSYPSETTTRGTHRTGSTHGQSQQVSHEGQSEKVCYDVESQRASVSKSRDASNSHYSWSQEQASQIEYTNRVLQDQYLTYSQRTQIMQMLKREHATDTDMSHNDFKQQYILPGLKQIASKLSSSRRGCSSQNEAVLSSTINPDLSSYVKAAYNKNKQLQAVYAPYNTKPVPLRRVAMRPSHRRKVRFFYSYLDRKTVRYTLCCLLPKKANHKYCFSRCMIECRNSAICQRYTIGICAKRCNEFRKASQQHTINGVKDLLVDCVSELDSIIYSNHLKTSNMESCRNSFMEEFDNLQIISDVTDENNNISQSSVDLKDSLWQQLSKELHRSDAAVRSHYIRTRVAATTFFNAIWIPKYLMEMCNYNPGVSCFYQLVTKIQCGHCRRQFKQPLHPVPSFKLFKRLGFIAQARTLKHCVATIRHQNAALKKLWPKNVTSHNSEIPQQVCCALPAPSTHTQRAEPNDPMADTDSPDVLLRPELVLDDLSAVLDQMEIHDGADETLIDARSPNLSNCTVKTYTHSTSSGAAFNCVNFEHSSLEFIAEKLVPQQDHSENRRNEMKAALRSLRTRLNDIGSQRQLPQESSQICSEHSSLSSDRTKPTSQQSNSISIKPPDLFVDIENDSLPPPEIELMEDSESPTFSASDNDSSTDKQPSSQSSEPAQSSFNSPPPSSRGALANKLPSTPRRPSTPKRLPVKPPNIFENPRVRRPVLAKLRQDKIIEKNKALTPARPKKPASLHFSHDSPQVLVITPNNRGKSAREMKEKRERIRARKRLENESREHGYYQ